MTARAWGGTTSVGDGESRTRAEDPQVGRPGGCSETGGEGVSSGTGEEGGFRGSEVTIGGSDGSTVVWTLPREGRLGRSGVGSGEESRKTVGPEVS